MKKIFWLLFVIILVIGCSNKSTPKNETFNKIAPPATKMVGANIFVDKTELKNIDYLEYLYWVSRIYGKASEAYQMAIPDSKVFLSGPEKIKKIGADYYKNPKYNNHSVVGLTKSQVNNFISWRTDRVAEALLIENGNVHIQPQQNPTNHFTIERYLAGSYQWTIKQVSEITVPVYTLPTADELAVYGPKVKTKYLIKESEIQKNGSKRPAYAKGFWCVARYQKFVQKIE